MTPSFRSSSSVASAPRGCGGDGCASGRDTWPLHHVCHEGVFCRLCSSCVLLYHPTAFCSACLHLLSPDSAAEAPGLDPSFAPPGPTAACTVCGLSAAHHSCVPDPASFVCPPCAAAAERRPFSFTPAPAAGGARRPLDERAARVLLIAARLAHNSVARAAAAARQEAERCVQEAAVARKRSREMLDAAFRALEAEARDAKMPTAAAPSQPKKKTPKSTEANRDKDKLLKLNAVQQPGLAFAAAAAAAAAASSMPLSTPPSRENKTPAKQDAQASAAREDRNLFGTLQS